MALFKVFKGPRFVTVTATGQITDKLQSGKPQTNDGWAYFTEDDGKFYIDITTGDNAIIKDDQNPGGNRVPLNAYKADTLSQPLSVLLGGTGATTAIEGLYNLQGISNITASTNIPSYISTATFDKIGTVATFNIEISEATSNTSGLMSINDKINLNQCINDNGKVQQVSNTSGSSFPLLFSTTWTPVSGMKDITYYNNNLRYSPDEGTLNTGNLYLTGYLQVVDQAYFNSDTTFHGQITTNSLLIKGEAVAQTPSAAQHIATKGYVDNAISQGFAANDAMVFKGTVTATSGFTTILSQTYSAGWTYRADGSFFLSGSNRTYYVEPGDLIIATQDKGSNGSINDWIVVEHNIDGGLYKSSTTFTNGAILLADGIAGKVKTGLLSTTTAVAITGISSTTASITKIISNTSVTASKITSNNSVTVVTSVSLDSSTSTAIGSVVDGVLIIGEAVTDIGTITTGTATASQISATAVTATNTSYTATTVVTNTTSSTANVVTSVSIS